jgi:hypothetical protein
LGGPGDRGHVEQLEKVWLIDEMLLIASSKTAIGVPRTGIETWPACTETNPPAACFDCTGLPHADARLAVDRRCGHKPPALNVGRWSRMNCMAIRPEGEYVRTPDGCRPSQQQPGLQGE